MLMKELAMNIVTRYNPPPIPTSAFDWAATLPGYEPGEAIGYGSTEQEAIKDLLDQLEGAYVH